MHLMGGWMNGQINLWLDGWVGDSIDGNGQINR